MDFASFVEGPLLWMAFSLFVVGTSARVSFFFYAIIKKNNPKDHWPLNLARIVARTFLPLHHVFVKKPAYTTLRYIFHTCMVIVPIWFGGHINLWEESRFGWTWTPLPDAWADWMTLVLLGIAGFFLLRHVISSDSRSGSAKSGYLLIMTTAMPFLTGYFLTHEGLEGIPFLENNLWTIHILSGEAMLLVTVFLFFGIRLKQEICTGCVACGLSCPTFALESFDKKRMRIICFSHYPCIFCGSCLKICPEEAVVLRHEISIRRFFQITRKREINSVRLEICEKCGFPYASEPLLSKLTERFSYEYLDYCPKCRGSNYTRLLHRRSQKP